MSINSLDDLRDSDSPTNSSISTVVSRSTIVNGGTPTMLGNQDSRFGNRKFSTFFAEPEAATSVSNSDLANESSPLVSPTTDNQQTDNNRDAQNNIQNSTDNLSDESAAKSPVRSPNETTSEVSEIETDSESTASVSDAEKQPLISVRKEEFMYDNEASTTMPEYIQSESDTDSVSTPTDSPSKSRLESLSLNPPPLKSATDIGKTLLAFYLLYFSLNTITNHF